MKEVLHRLGTVPDVIGSAFFDVHGNCICAHSADIVREDELANLGPLVTSLFSDATGPRLARTQTAYLRFDEGVLIVKRTRDYLLVVLARPGSDLSTGGMGFHVGVAARLLGIHTSRIPPRESRTMPIAQEIEEVAVALRAPRVPRV